VPRESQQSPEVNSAFFWLSVALTAGRGEIHGPPVEFLQAAFALAPGKAKFVPTVVGPKGQLCALHDEDRLAIMRKSFRTEMIDWALVEASEVARDAVRLLASVTEIRAILDANRKSIRLSFPSELGKTGLVDFKHEIIVVVSGLLVEFWNIDDWRLFLRGTVESREMMLGSLETLTKSP
jgi:hypothetical protein